MTYLSNTIPHSFFSKMSTIFFTKFLNTNHIFPLPHLSKTNFPHFISSRNPPPYLLTLSSSRPLSPLRCASHGSEPAETSSLEDDNEWLKKLPDKKKPLYSHSLPCIEAWLRSLGFRQGKEDRAVWFVEKGEWHAQLSLDVTDLYIRYLKSGPGNLEKDVERRFSYALSREDIENATLGGP